MTTFVGKSAAIANGTTSVAPAYPAGLAAGDLLVLCITNKYPTNKPAIPAGWTLAPDLQQSGGSGASGIDTGSVYCTVMTKRATGAESGSLAVTITSGNSAVAVILAYRPTAGKQFALSYCNGADNTAGTAWSVTGNVNPGLDAGDWVIVASAINTDGYTYLSEAISATGTTWGTVTERFDGGTISGQDCGIVVSDHVVSTGPSTAAPVYTMTASSSGTNNPAGASCMLRLREMGDVSSIVTPASDVWPKQAAPNANNFLDHFPGASLNGRWTAVTSTTGTVTVSDSNAVCDSGATAGSAYGFYYNTKVDKTKCQLWMACVDRVVSGPIQVLQLLNKTTAPVADTDANINTITRARIGIDEAADGGKGVETTYFSSAHTETWFDGSASQFTTTRLGLYANVNLDDYYVVGLEIDGPNGRFRMMGWCQGYVSGYTFEQGWRLFGLTDWVPIASLEATGDLWIVFGNLATNNGRTQTFRYEWIRYIEANATLPYIEAWTASKALTADGHHIRHHYSYDGTIFLPEQSGLDAIGASATGWDSKEVQAPSMAYDGNVTDYCFYYGEDATLSATGIGIAKATHGKPQNGPWTKAASNPKLSPVAGEDFCGYPVVVKDDSEPDSAKRWKIVYSVKATTGGKWRTHLATSPDPPDTSTWTKQGVVIDVGAGGAADENAARVGAILWYGNQWEVWYEGWASSGQTALLRATGPSLAALTKDGVGDRLPPQANGTTTLTANLTGRTATVASTIGFAVDGFVVVDQDATGDNYGTSRVRKVTDATHLELYHGLDGFTTTAPAKIRQVDAVKRFSPRGIIRVGSEWWFYVTIWGAFDDDATFRALLEQDTLYTHSNAAPSGATPALSQLASPVTSRGFNGDLRSVENISLRLPPVIRQTIFAAALGTATAASPSATITGGSGAGDATMTAVLATATALTPSASITGAATFAAVLVTATASSPAAAVTGGATVAAALSTASASSAVVVITASSSLAATATSATASSPVAAVLASSTLPAGFTTATALSAAATITGGGTVTAALVTATASAPAVTIIASSVLGAAAATATALSPASNWTASSTVAAALTIANATTPAATLTATNVGTLAAATGTATASSPTAALLTSSVFASALTTATAASPTAALTGGTTLLAATSTATGGSPAAGLLASSGLAAAVTSATATSPTAAVLASSVFSAALTAASASGPAAALIGGVALPATASTASASAAVATFIGGCVLSAAASAATANSPAAAWTAGSILVAMLISATALALNAALIGGGIAGGSIALGEAAFATMRATELLAGTLAVTERRVGSIVVMGS